MKVFFTTSQVSILASIFLTSCLGSKFLRENEQLLTKYEIEGVSRSIKDDTNALIERIPNSRPFGIFKSTPLGFIVIPFTHLAHTYQFGENGAFFLKGYDINRIKVKKDSLESKFEAKILQAENDNRKQNLRNRIVKKLDKKDRKIREGNLLMRWGERLAVYDHNKSIVSQEKIKQYLNSKGFFNSKIKIDTSTINKKKRTLLLSYKIDLGVRHVIDSIEYIIPDTVLQQLIWEEIPSAQLKKGFYDQEILMKEREHIYNLAVNNGYFEFSKQYVSFEIDSTKLGSDTLLVREIIRNPPDQNNHKIFYLDSIVFFFDASDSPTYQRTPETYKDITFSFEKNKYSKKILQWRIPLEQDGKYSRDQTIETQRQLAYLDNFKFVNINYDTTGRRFVANIFASSLNKYQTSSEFGFVQNNTNSKNPSPFFNLSLKNRNTFRALEVISIDVNAKVEDIQGVSGEQQSGYSSRQYGSNLSFSFPQFLFPLGRYYKKKIGRFNPQTLLSVGLGLEDRFNEYVRRTIKTSFSYSWQIRDQLKYVLTPLQASFIKSDNDPRFQNFLQRLEDEGNTYANSFRSAFVSSTSFQLDLNLGEYNIGKDGGFVQFFIEAGGNLNNIFGENAFGDSIETYQFVKTNIDLRKIEKITRKLNIAYRLNIGIAYAYGNNNSLFYEKYFFAGGSSSVRAWKPRRLGPGAFGITQGSNRVDFTREQPGDLLIESSFEFRQKLVGFLKGVVFVDAGNVWLIRGSSVNPSDDPEGDDGKFRFGDFMDEMAVGTGVGLRFDLSFFILRLDLGLKLFDPAQPKGKHFIGDHIFSNFGFNSEINIGIGHSF